MAVGSGSVSNRNVSGKDRVMSPPKNESKSQEDAATSSPAKRNRSPRIRVVGGRIYDSINGKSCHQCRQKTMDFTARCKNQDYQKRNKPCLIMYCHKCLLNRYGEKAEEVDVLEEWNCPKCRDICNCSICMKKRGHQPTGILINTAKATGYSSVSEMLLKGAEILKQEKVAVADASPTKEVVSSPKKRGKENSFDGKIDANLPNHVDRKSKKVKVNKGNNDDYISSKAISQNPDYNKLKQEAVEDKHDCKEHEAKGTSPCGSGKSKKMKRDRSDEIQTKKNDVEILEKTSVHADEKKLKKTTKDKMEKDCTKFADATLARRTSPRKFTVSNKIPTQDPQLNTGVVSDKNVNDGKTVTKKHFVKSLKKDMRKEDEVNTAEDKVVKYQMFDFYAEHPLPLGIELNTVAKIDVPAEDVGNVLQFLEFCSVFGKILDVKKGQPEYVIQDLLHGRTGRGGRRGKFSVTVQLHIHLLSILQTELGEECEELSPSNGKSSWFPALKKFLSQSQSVLKAYGLDSLEKAMDYESLEVSEKLRLLNFLCDEILGTEKVRNWMEDQNMALAEKIKEVRQKVLAAKDTEKSLKQKMSDDIAKAIIAKHGAPLSISEHDAIVSKIKRKTEAAHAKLLESQGLLLEKNRTCESVRIEPIFVGRDGIPYWKLNCSGDSDVLRQNIGEGDTLTLNEKWFGIDDEGKQVLGKHILRRKNTSVGRQRRLWS